MKLFSESFKKGTAFAAAFVLAAVAAGAQEVRELTVEQAVEYSIENSRTLKAADIDLALSKWKKDTAKNTFLPTVQVSGTLNRANKYSNTMAGTAPLYEALGGTMSAVGASHPELQGLITAGQKLTGAASAMNAGETESKHWTAVGNIGITFNFNAAMIQSMRATIAEYETGLLTWDEAKKQNENNVRKMFYGILLAQESVNLQKQSLENARQRMNQAQVNYRNGYTPELSLLQTQVSYENLRPNVEKAEQGLNQQLDMFAFILGMPVGTKIKLDGKISPDFIDVDLEQLLRMAEDSNITIQSLKKNIAILKLRKSALDLSSYTPSLSISWGYQPTSIGSAGAFDMDWSNKDNWLDRGNLSATLVFNITNMLPWSGNRVQARELKDTISKMEINLESLRQNTELEIRTAVDTLGQARKSIEASERNIRLAQRSYDMMAVAYRNGTKELLDLRDAENQLNQAKLAFANEGYNYISAILDLEYKLNTKLTKEKK